MRKTGHKRIRHEGTSHRLSGRQGRVARRVVTGTSIEVGVTTCMRVSWEDNAVYKGRRGGSRLLIVMQSGEGGAKPHQARRTQRGSAPATVDYNQKRRPTTDGKPDAKGGRRKTKLITTYIVRRKLEPLRPSSMQSNSSAFFAEQGQSGPPVRGNPEQHFLPSHTAAHFCSDN